MPDILEMVQPTTIIALPIKNPLSVNTTTLFIAIQSSTPHHIISKQLRRIPSIRRSHPPAKTVISLYGQLGSRSRNWRLCWSFFLARSAVISASSRPGSLPPDTNFKWAPVTRRPPLSALTGSERRQLRWEIPARGKQRPPRSGPGHPQTTTGPNS